MTVDTVADAAITVTVDNITVDTGFRYNNDFLTSSTSHTLNTGRSGKLGAGGVQVSMDGGTTRVLRHGKRYPVAPPRAHPADGDYAIVRVVDQAATSGPPPRRT